MSEPQQTLPLQMYIHSKQDHQKCRSARQRRETFLSAFCCCLAQSCHFERVYSEVFMRLPSGHNGRHFINCQPVCLKPMVHIVSFSLINLKEFINFFNGKCRHKVTEGSTSPLQTFFLSLFVSTCQFIRRPHLKYWLRGVFCPHHHRPQPLSRATNAKQH